jgi:hypothetical protein
MLQALYNKQRNLFFIFGTVEKTGKKYFEEYFPIEVLGGCFQTIENLFQSRSPCFSSSIYLYKNRVLVL